MAPSRGPHEATGSAGGVSLSGKMLRNLE